MYCFLHIIPGICPVEGQSGAVQCPDLGVGDEVFGGCEIRRRPGIGGVTIIALFWYPPFHDCIGAPRMGGYTPRAGSEMVRVL